MPYAPATIANFFLDKASEDARALTPMQIIKLVYIAHGWHLGYLGEPLINEEVEAWRYGPVIQSLYQELKKYGSGAVTARLPVRSGVKLENDTASLLHSVWKSYAAFSGVQLSSMTHQQHTPWWTAWHAEGGKQFRNVCIPDSVIEEHYRAKIEAASQAVA